MGDNIDDLLVSGHHALSVVVLTALREGHGYREDMPTMMARAVRSVLDVEPAMSISDAYQLVNQLWVR